MALATASIPLARCFMVPLRTTLRADPTKTNGLQIDGSRMPVWSFPEPTRAGARKITKVECSP